MEPTNYTFWGLLERCAINIPLIQRDYAQGREEEKVTAIRTKLLDDIHTALTLQKPLDFDFVYGDIADNELIPLDGQQRLTTLFLLHWYLACRDGQLAAAQEKLLKFNYKNRVSAREFCTELVKKGVPIPLLAVHSLKSVIRESAWFRYVWEEDLTVQSMLTMLEDIHKKFCLAEGYFERLSTSTLVNFQFLSVAGAGLTDNLYIKMNARGKPLTEFENTKAKFEQFLEKVHPACKKEFTEKVDGVWTDYFWLHKQKDLIDAPFMRYWNFVTEMLYFSQATSVAATPIPSPPKLHTDWLDIVYRHREHVDFLFAALDKLNEIGDVDAFFSALFAPLEYTPGKVALFEQNVNLFQACINNEGFGIKERVLLFIIVKYLIQQQRSTPDDNLRDLVRVVRNLLLRVRQLTNTQYSSNLRIEQVPEQLQTIAKHLISGTNVYDILAMEEFELKGGISRESLAFERAKALLIQQQPSVKAHLFVLEDYPLLKGSIHHLDPSANAGLLPTFAQAIAEIWSLKNDSLVTRALLTFGDYSIDVGGSKLGTKYFFGNGEHWHSILTHPGTNLTGILPSFLTKYISSSQASVEEKLKETIEDWLSASPPRDWSYYFIKYPAITSSPNNVYAWATDFKIRLLTGVSLLSVHINPYAKAVAEHIGDWSICNKQACEGLYGEESPLRLQTGISLYCMDEGWAIAVPEGYELAEDTIARFGLKLKTPLGKYILQETAEEDRIAVAVAFALNATLSKVQELQTV